VRSPVALAVVVVVACGSSYSEGDGVTAPIRPTGEDGGLEAAAVADGGEDGAPAGPRVSTSVITRTHRFVPGKMFGGWGPHLGHLLRRASPAETWFADDACEQPCNVDVDERIDYFRLDAAGWTKVTSQALPATVQQNTGSILAGDTIFTYGVDVQHGQLVECKLTLTTLAKSCAAMPVTIGASSNYVGAALAPNGWKVVWLTNVVDGGNGKFQWFVDYGGGWNGPRTGDIGGYNDASYIHAAFDGTKLLMHAELVIGNAPNWTFTGGVGTVDVSSADAVTFATQLAPLMSDDPILSTDDIAIDPATRDAHLLARTKNGAALYYHRPPDGAWSAALFSFPATFRARLVFAADQTLYVLYGPGAKGLAWRAAPAAARAAGQPLAFASLTEHAVVLPAGYESIDAIYTESSVYQSAPVEGLRAVVVGDTTQNEALFVAIDP